jgi:hypothetical protein
MVRKESSISHHGVSAPPPPPPPPPPLLGVPGALVRVTEVCAEAAGGAPVHVSEYVKVAAVASVTCPAPLWRRL